MESISHGPTGLSSPQYTAAAAFALGVRSSPVKNGIGGNRDRETGATVIERSVRTAYPILLSIREKGRGDRVKIDRFDCGFRGETWILERLERTRAALVNGKARFAGSAESPSLSCVPIDRIGSTVKNESSERRGVAQLG